MFGHKSMAELVAEARTRIPEIDPPDLEARAREGTCLHIDVREPDEWAHARIPGAIFVPLESLGRDIGLRAFGSPALTAEHLATPVVVSCARGRRSLVGADHLRAMGFTNVVSLRGGIEGWIASGRPVEK